MIHLPRNNVACEPIFDPDKIGSIWVPDQAKERCDQGIVKYIGPEVRSVRPGDYVLFSGYAGTLMELKGEELIIILPDDFIVCKIKTPPTEVPGLYFRDKDGTYFPATWEMVTKLSADAFKNAEWRRSFGVKVPQPSTEDYDNL